VLTGVLAVRGVAAELHGLIRQLAGRSTPGHPGHRLISVGFPRSRGPDWRIGVLWPKSWG